jgi:glycosyltransferase involved in cell wall biosynthesis
VRRRGDVPRGGDPIGELVLIAGRDPTREAGGAESYMLGHARAARLAGLSPHVFALGPARATLALDWGVLHRVPTPMRPILATSAVLHRRWLVPELVRFLRGRPGPHVVHGHGGWSDLAADAALRLAAAGVPATAVGTFFTTAAHGESAKFRGALGHPTSRLQLSHAVQLAWVKTVGVPSERRGYRTCQFITLNYESVRTLLEEAYGSRPGVQRLAYAAETAFRSDPGTEGGPAGTARGKGERTPLILAVSRHSARKGLDILIRALGALRDDGVRFRACLVGEGTLLAANRRLVRSQQLTDRVTLPGRVPDVMPYLLECDVFVLPSTQEGSGSVAVLEALQAGAAVVSTNVDGMPEDLTHDVDSLLVAPGSPGALRDAIRRLLGDEALRRRLGTQARVLYERRFSPAVAASSLAAFYAPLGLE